MDVILFTSFSGFYFFLLLLALRGINRSQGQRNGYYVSLVVVVACWVFSTYITLFV
jgi:hypothetical protein